MSEQQGGRRDDGIASHDELGRDPPAPAALGAAGGERGCVVGLRDEPTRGVKQDKGPPATSSRSDREDAQR